MAACGGGRRPPLPVTQRTWSPKRHAIPLGTAGRPVWIRGVTVIDVRDGSRGAGRDLLIENGCIATLGASGSLTPPQGVEVYEAEGLYAIPGLWDMHTHLSSWGDAGRDIGFRLLLANGVTGVRDMGGFEGFLPRWRREIRQGAVGPRLFHVGQALSGPTATARSMVRIVTEADARAAVRRMKQAGADFIKVHDGLPAEVYPAVIEEARTAGLPVVGHAPRALTAKQVSDAGQKSIEHMFGIAAGWDGYFNPKAIRAPEERVTPAMRELFETLERNGTWVTPTTAVLLKVVRAADDAYDRWPRRRYAPYSLQGLWDVHRRRLLPDVSLEERRQYAEQELAIVGAMHRAGVKMLAGSDTGGDAFDAAPGFELHDELRMLVKSGLTPLEALKCATWNPAEFLEREDSYGSVEAGKTADLVILSADPTEDIGNLERIEAVVLRGNLYRREDLDELLKQAEELAKRM